MGGPCDFSVSPSPFGLDFVILDCGTSDLGLTIRKESTNTHSFTKLNVFMKVTANILSVHPEHGYQLDNINLLHYRILNEKLNTNYSGINTF